MRLKMDNNIIKGFSDELVKISNKLSMGLDLAGLGMLAAPTAYKKITGKKVSEKTSDVAELGGLGTLAASVGAHLLKRK